uniref:Ovule protein n=1 Tax=Haemonchus placei TaxID=6290 RepID=A0A0N4X897_HAEPC
LVKSSDYFHTLNSDIHSLDYPHDSICQRLISHTQVDNFYSNLKKPMQNNNGSYMNILLKTYVYLQIDTQKMEKYVSRNDTNLHIQVN